MPAVRSASCGIFDALKICGNLLDHNIWHHKRLKRR
jgi:hypothetical protein